MNPVQMIQRGIQNAGLSPQSVAKADAAITRAIGHEVERAVRVANACSTWKSSGPATAAERLSAARLTSRWEGLAYDAEETIAVAIGATDSYEEAARAIEGAAGL